MQRYDTYKDSGVKWLGEIPSHWEVKRFKHFGTFSKGKLPKNTNLDGIGFPIIGASEMKGKEPSVFTEDINVPHCLPYEILILWDGANAGLVANNKKGVVASTAVKYTCIDDSINDRYLFYLVKNYQRYYKDKVSGTTIPHMNIAFINDTPLLVPKYAEQTAIANYLDAATAKIDAAIAQQQKMIDLLNERKQIIINRAVTKGLNPNAKMKDSGVEWIGEVPEHWDVMRMRYLCSITTGNKDTINRIDDGLYPFYVRSPKVERINTYSYDGEAVLMAGDGVGAGKVFHYVNGKFDYHQRVYNFYNIKKIKAKLLYYYMKSHFRYVIEQLSAKSTVDSVRLNMIQDFLVVIPPMQEQLDLIEYFDSQMKNLDDSISMFENQISLLQERKQIIINEVVTGKVKVV